MIFIIKNENKSKRTEPSMELKDISFGIELRDFIIE